MAVKLTNHNLWHYFVTALREGQAWLTISSQHWDFIAVPKSGAPSPFSLNIHLLTKIVNKPRAWCQLVTCLACAIKVIFANNKSCAGEEPANDQSYKYLTTEMDKIPDDSVDMDTREEKKNSTISRSNDPYSDTIEATLLKLEQKERPSFDRNFDESWKSDNIAVSVPPVNAG